MGLFIHLAQHTKGWIVCLETGYLYKGGGVGNSTHVHVSCVSVGVQSQSALFCCPNTFPICSLLSVLGSAKKKKKIQMSPLSPLMSFAFCLHISFALIPIPTCLRIISDSFLCVQIISFFPPIGSKSTHSFKTQKLQAVPGSFSVFASV